jgi:hypothetical protein
MLTDALFSGDHAGVCIMSEQRDEQFSKYWFIGTNPEDHVKHLEKYIKMGFQHIDVVSSSPDEIKTLKMYAKNVLPYMHSTFDH